jgi:hypothetical protein
MQNITKEAGFEVHRIRRRRNVIYNSVKLQLEDILICFYFPRTEVYILMVKMLKIN